MVIAMKMNVFLLVYFLCALEVSAMALRPSDNPKYLGYKVKTCIVNPDIVIFPFEADKKSLRSFGIEKSTKKLYISSPDGKGELNWTDIEKIIFFSLNENEGYIVMEFVKPVSLLSWKSYKSIEFGVMSSDHWQILLDTVSAEIVTERISSWSAVK